MKLEIEERFEILGSRQRNGVLTEAEIKEYEELERKLDDLYMDEVLKSVSWN